MINQTNISEFKLENNNKNIEKIILRLPSVKIRTGYSRSAIYLMISKGTFPKPIILGPRTVGWLESEINEWLEDRIKITKRLFEERKKGNFK